MRRTEESAETHCHRKSLSPHSRLLNTWGLSSVGYAHGYMLPSLRGEDRQSLTTTALAWP